MKVQLTFKTPDVTDQLEDQDTPEIREQLEKWLQFGECITIEFDLDTDVASVAPRF